jgi:hypothetical protein
MKVYLAGKVDAKYGAWRDAILGTRDEWVSGKQISYPRWVLYLNDRGGLDWNQDDAVVLPWRGLDRGVFGTHEYVGPYRQVYGDDGSNTGYFHGVESFGQHGMVMDELMAGRVVERCRTAIAASDIVFGYINSPDAYGTLAELGYAVGLGKFVSILVHPCAPFEPESIDGYAWDFWFLREFATHQAVYPATTHRAEECSYSPAGERDYGMFHLRHEPDERVAVVSALKDAFVAYAAWAPPHQQLQDMKDRVAAGMVRQSFEQIAQWSADPRVRNEAKRMMRQLS